MLLKRKLRKPYNRCTAHVECKNKYNTSNNYLKMPIPVAERSKAWVCSRSPAGIAGSNPAEGMDICLLWVLCVCQVEISGTGWSLVQRSPTDCDASLRVISEPQEWGG
jgi:hypothetical protein